MTGHPPSVTLEFWTLPDTLIAESDAVAHFAAHPAALTSTLEQEGVIVIAGGGEPLRVGDVMMWMVPALCFDAVKALLEGGTGTADAFSNATHVELRGKGKASRVSISDEAPQEFDTAALAEALVAAGERFVALVEKLWPVQAATVLDSVRPRAAAARAALGSPPPGRRKK